MSKSKFTFGKVERDFYNDRWEIVNIFFKGDFVGELRRDGDFWELFALNSIPADPAELTTKIDNAECRTLAAAKKIVRDCVPS